MQTDPLQPRQGNRSLVFLTGFMGSGKSTIGPILANTLGFEFVDVDKLIEQKSQQRLVDFFASKGEQEFRVLERDTLQKIAGLNHCVVSLGGGTIANEENFRLIRQCGIIVYLQLSPDEILQRVQRRSDRPLLKDAEGRPLARPQLEQRVLELLRKREEFYVRADIIVPGDGKRVGVTVDEIVRKLRGYIP